MEKWGEAMNKDCEKCLSPLACLTECQATVQPMENQDLVYRLRKRAQIRRQNTSRKSVLEGKTDRIADLLEEAAMEIERLDERNDDLMTMMYVEQQESKWDLFSLGGILLCLVLIIVFVSWVV